MIEAVWNVAKAALLPINLPFTVLIAGVAFYWLLVVLGTLDFEFGGHDVDLGGGDGADAHAGQGHAPFLPSLTRMEGERRVVPCSCLRGLGAVRLGLGRAAARPYQICSLGPHHAVPPEWGGAVRSAEGA